MFDDWLRLFMHVEFCHPNPNDRDTDSIASQYAFLLTRRGQYDLANEVLRHLLFSNAFQSRPSQDSIRLGLISTLTLVTF